MHDDLTRRAEAWLSSPEAMTAADDLISDLLAALKAQQPAPAGDDGLPPLPEPVAWFRAPYGTLEPNPLFRVTGPQALEWSVRCFTEHQFRQAQREAMAVERERYNTLFHAYSEVCADAAVRADEIERLTRELAELKSDRDSWIDQASQRAQETVEAMQQVEAYRLRCGALHSAPREPLTDEQVDALWKEPMSADWEHREFARAIERAIASQPVAQREPLTDEQCDSIYSALHEWAQECDRHELGLPMFGDEKTRGREVIRRASERAHNIGADAGDDQGEPR